MRATTVCVWMSVMALAGNAAAQTPAAGAKAPAKASVSATLKQNWDSMKVNIRESATMMDEANYAFKPVDTVRTYGQILAHVAGASYVFCASAKGEKSPFEEDHFEKIATGKAAIVKAVNDGIAYCDAAYDALTDATGAESVELPFGMGQGSRSFPLVINYGHYAEHYGNLVTYLRIKGLVPPSSRQR